MNYLRATHLLIFFCLFFSNYQIYANPCNTLTQWTEWLLSHPGEIATAGAHNSNKERNVYMSIHRRFGDRKTFFQALKEAAKECPDCVLAKIYNEMVFTKDGHFISRKIINWFKDNPHRLPNEKNALDKSISYMIIHEFGSHEAFVEALKNERDNNPELAEIYHNLTNQPDIDEFLLNWLIKHPGETPNRYTPDEIRATNIIRGDYGSISGLLIALQDMAKRFPEHPVAQVSDQFVRTSNGTYVPLKVVLWLESNPGEIPDLSTTRKTGIATSMCRQFGNTRNFLKEMKEETEANPNGRLAAIYRKLEYAHIDGVPFPLGKTIKWMQQNPGSVAVHHFGISRGEERNLANARVKYIGTIDKFISRLAILASKNPGSDIEAVYSQLTLLPDGSFVDPRIIIWMLDHPGVIPNSNKGKDPEERNAAMLIKFSIGTVEKFRYLISLYAETHPDHPLATINHNLLIADTTESYMFILSDENYPKELRAVYIEKLLKIKKGSASRKTLIREIEAQADAIDSVTGYRDKLIQEVEDMVHMSRLRRNRLSEDANNIFGEWLGELSRPQNVSDSEEIQKEAKKTYENMLAWLFEHSFDQPDPQKLGFPRIKIKKKPRGLVTVHRNKKRAINELREISATLPEETAKKIIASFDNSTNNRANDYDCSKEFFDAEFVIRCHIELNKLNNSSILERKIPTDQLDQESTAEQTLTALKISVSRYINLRLGKVKKAKDNSGIYLRKLQGIILTILNAATPEQIADQLRFAIALKKYEALLNKHEEKLDIIFYETFLSTNNINEFHRLLALYNLEH